MSGGQAAAASAAVLLPMEEIDRTETSGGENSSNQRGSYTPLVEFRGPSKRGSANSTEVENRNHPTSSSPELLLEEARESGLDIQAFWQSVKAPGTEENLKFMSEVEDYLQQQSEKAVIDEEPLDQAAAEGRVFAKWLVQRVTPDAALLSLTKVKWIRDQLTAKIIDGLLKEQTANPAATDRNGNTPLHFIARTGYQESARVLLSKDRLLWRFSNNNGKLPLDDALDLQKVSMSILLIESMPNKEVRQLFHKKRVLSDLINDSSMKDAAHAIIDRLLDVWENEEEMGRGYDIFYEALESDDQGRIPGDEGFDGAKGVFTQILTKPDLYNEFGHERAVRMLLNFKWNKYGERMLMFSTLAFFLFMAILTFAAIDATDAHDPASYSDAEAYVRAVAEVITMLVISAQLITEVLDMIGARHNPVAYFGETYNYVQLSSFILLLLVIPLRFEEYRSQWVVLSLGYLITGLRFFKFISSSSIIGIYIRVLIGISVKVLPKFFLVFLFALFAWSGAFYPSLRSHLRGKNITLTGATVEETDLDKILELKSYGEVIFLGLRVMIEGRNLIRYYDNEQTLGALPVFLYLLFLVVVVMIMRTILIAHMAATFGALNRDAVHQLELSRAWILPGLESGKIWEWFFGGWRQHFYSSFEKVTEKRMQELLQEEKVDGFLKLERILRKQQQQMEDQQQQTIGQLTHQTVLQEKWTSQLMQAIKGAETGLRQEVDQTRAKSDEWGQSLSSTLITVKGHLSGQLEEAQTEQEKAAMSIQEKILIQTTETGRRMGELERRMQAHEENQKKASETLTIVDNKLIIQKEDTDQQTGMISTLSDTEQAEAEKAKSMLRNLEDRVQTLSQTERADAESAQTMLKGLESRLNLLSEAERVDAASAQAVLKTLEDRMVRQEEEGRLLAKRLNQQGYQLEQVVEVLQRLEAASNKLMAQMAALRRPEDRTFEEKKGFFERAGAAIQKFADRDSPSPEPQT